MITDHIFHNKCMTNCPYCRADVHNECSVVIDDYGKQCHKTRAHHLKIEEESTYQPYTK